jgi:tetratricopeptide (TPR) repeat protein
MSDDALMAQSLGLARHHINTGRAEKALAVLADGPADLALSLDGWFLRTLALYRLERYEQAIAAAERGLAVDPEAPGLLHLAGLAYMQRSDLASAERSYLAALRLDPTDADIFCSYARLCALGGQLDKARRLLDEAARLEPEATEILRVRWSIAHLAGDRQEEARLSGQLLALAPEDPQAHVMASLSRGPRAAARHLGQAARLDPGDTDNVEAARAARLIHHPLMWPLWPMLRLGQVGSWLFAMSVMVGLRAFVSTRVAAIFALIWIGLCVYSWLVPPVLARWNERD